MTVQRQYTLPNCNLIIDGLTEDQGEAGESPLTVVLNAECQFPGIADPVSGGREFLNGLVQAVSQYAQSLLSGVTTVAKGEAVTVDPVSIWPGDRHYHHLQLAAEGGDAAEIKLTTVQFFDLVEAIDQLLADTQTLPDLTLTLAPLSRRAVRPPEPVTQRMAPAVVGTSALAAAAVALFFLPIPELQPSRSQNEAQEPTASETAATEPETTGEPPTAEGIDSSDVPENVLAAAEGLALAQAAPTITDADTLAQLEEQLTTALESALSQPSTFESRLAYQVAVSESGDILGYQPESDAASQNVAATPLDQMGYLQIPEEPLSEPVAEFRVIFLPNGTVRVETLSPRSRPFPAAPVRLVAAQEPWLWLNPNGAVISEQPASFWDVPTVAALSASERSRVATGDRPRLQALLPTVGNGPMGWG